MGRTDNTRPYELQSRDWTEKGYISHQCTKRRGRSTKWKPSRTTPVSLEVIVSNGSLVTKERLTLAGAKVPYGVVLQNGRPARLQVNRRRNTTTAKAMACLHELFGEVQLLPRKPAQNIASHECNERSCQRVLLHYGGQNYIHGHARDERKLRRRRMRRREKAALYLAQHNLVDEFDLLPTREDKKTIIYDLS